MTTFSEWQQMPQTKAFIESLKQTIEQTKLEAVQPSGSLSLEQIAIATIERNASVNVIEQVIEILTSKESDDEQT